MRFILSLLLLPLLTTHCFIAPPPAHLHRASHNRPLLSTPPTPLTPPSSYLKGDFSSPSPSISPLRRRLSALYEFSRPHTIRGTVLASLAGTTRALMDSPAYSPFPWGVLIPRAAVGCLALLLGNAFIVGINQIYDKPIDVINKPFLPVASGEISEKFAWVAVASSGLLGPLIVNRFFSPFLRNLYLLGWVLGAAYSVPPIRTKRSPILAAATIATVRGFLLNFGVYYAVKEAIGAPFVWNPKVTFIARFMTVFASVIAVTKDLPDTEGDAALNIPTLALKVGVKRVANVAVGVLFANYMVAVGVGLFGKAGAFNRPAMVVGHASLALWLGRNWKRVETDDIGSIKRFYKGIWDLFYCEYALYMII